MERNCQNRRRNGIHGDLTGENKVKRKKNDKNRMARHP